MSTTATTGAPETAKAAPQAQGPSPETLGASGAGAFATLSAAAEKFRDRMRSALLFRLFLWLKLPLAAFAGLRIKTLEADRCEVALPFGWRTQNPFGSMYFAAHTMAAEMSSGALVLLHASNYGEGTISTLVGKLEAEFKKAAKSEVVYRCEDGAVVAEAAKRAFDTGEPVECRTTTRGRTADGTIVAEFSIGWSRKRRSSAKK